MFTASVEEILQSDVVTADRDTPVRTVAAAMAEHDVGSVVVVEDRKPIGVLTDRKIALRLEDMPNLTDRTADDLLSGSLVTGSADMTVVQALVRLSEEEIRRLPIVDDDDSLLGIVTLDDLMYVLSRELSKATSVIEAQSSRI
jgi:CBS domain-containing protein